MTEGKHCSVCNTVLVAQTEDGALGHNFGAVIEANAATCEEAGNNAYKQCQTCNLYFAEDADKTAADGLATNESFVIPSLDHSFTGAIKSDGNGKDATHSYLCVNGCGTYGDAAKHSWNEGEESTPATCTTDGEITYTCTADGCGGTYTEDIPALQHNYTAEVTAEPTCTQTGVKTYTCQNDNRHTYTEDIPANGHTDQDNDYYCDVESCKALLCTNHSFTGEVTTPATCTGNGIMTYTCPECKHSYTEDVPANGHTFTLIAANAVTCEAAGNEAHYQCDICNLYFAANTDKFAGGLQDNKDFVIDALDHSFTNYVSNNDATCTAAGTMTEIVQAYFTESLDDIERAEYFLKQRLGNPGTRAQVRNAVYEAYMGNKTITTLESTRDFRNNDAAYLDKLRKASCYAFADYICRLAGDYVEITENPYYTDFFSETSVLAPGVTQEIHKATSADDKQMVYYLATADLTNPYVTVYANYHAADPELGWEMDEVLDQANAAQQKYGDSDSDCYIPNYQVVASINADGFNMSTGEPGGVLVMNGTEWHKPNGNGFFGITKDGKPVIGSTAEYKSKYKDRLRDAVAAFGTTLVKDGKVSITASSDYYSNRASRTAVGITRTGKVVFMVLDGRQEPVSCGGSMEEIARIML